MDDLVVIGYWRTDADTASPYPHPSDWVDWRWDEAERMLVADYLSTGTGVRHYMGLSTCRICGATNGASEFTDGTYVWPEGLAHYVLEHAVRLPTEVVAHVVARAQALERRGRSLSWWEAQPALRGTGVSAATSADPALPPELAATERAPATPREEPGPGPDGGALLGEDSDWLHLARILVSQVGPHILSASMRAVLRGDLAELTWTERHEMPADRYRTLVTEARVQMARRH